MAQIEETETLSVRLCHLCGLVQSGKLYAALHLFGGDGDELDVFHHQIAQEMVESFFNLSALCVGLLGKTVGQLALHQLAAVAYEIKDGQEEKV